MQCTFANYITMKFTVNVLKRVDYCGMLLDAREKYLVRTKRVIVAVAVNVSWSETSHGSGVWIRMDLLIAWVPLDMSTLAKNA